MSGLAALAVAYVFSQLYRSFLAVLTPQLTLELGMSKAELSFAAGLWFITFAASQFAVGVGLDRFGPRRTAASMFGLAGAGGAFLFAYAHSPLTLIVSMGLLGIGCAPILMASLYIFAQRYPVTRFAIMSSWLVAFGNLGNVVGTSPMAEAATRFGWRTVMLGLGFTNLLVALAILQLVRDPVTTQRVSDGFRGFLRLLKIPYLWAIFPMIMLCYAPVAGIRGLWAGPYLTDLYNADSLTIGRITFWMAVAMIVGSVLYGPMDRWFNTRKWIVLTGGLVTLVAISSFVIVPQPPLPVATLLFILIGVSGVSYAVLMAHGRAFIPAELMGRGVTLLNFFSIFGAGLLQFISGSVVAARTDPSSPASYQLLFATYAGLLFICLAIYMTSRDAKPDESVPL
ncbi:MAG: MFS transporter [Granulosicoccus sp.]